MNKKRIAIVGYGNIGRYSLEAIETAPDFEIAGIVRRNPADREDIPAEIPVVGSIKELQNVDVAILATPTRSVRLDEASKAGNAVSVLSAGWDPGSDSVVRALLEAIAPKGITYTNFGPGMSMGHTVAVKSKEGVKDALSMTIPLGTGIHRRMVYVELLPGYELATVAKSIKEDPYFASDETHVIAVESVDALKDVGHGVNMVRKGVSGKTHSQRFEFDMAINNPALTAQILVACARASFRLSPGCYTMIEIPVIDLLPGERDQWIKLV